MFRLRRVVGSLVCGALVTVTGCGGGVVDDRGASTVEEVKGDENAAGNVLKNTQGNAQARQTLSGPGQGQQGGPADPGGGGGQGTLSGGQGQQGGPADPGGGAGGGTLSGFSQGQGQQGGPGVPGGDQGALSGPFGQGQGQGQQGGPGVPGGNQGALAGPFGQGQGQGQQGGPGVPGGDQGALAGPFGQGQGQQGGPGAPGGDQGALAGPFGQQGQGQRRTGRDEEEEPERTPEESAERVVGLFLDALDNEEYEIFEQIISARATDVMLKRLRAGKSERAEQALQRLQEDYARQGASVVLEVTPMPDQLERRVAIGIRARTPSAAGHPLAYVAVRQEGKAWRIVSIRPTAAG